MSLAPRTRERTAQPSSDHRLLSTIAWQLGGERHYALEGSVFVAGSLVKWLRDTLKLIGDVAETDALARSVDDNGGVYLVPALSGLGVAADEVVMVGNDMDRDVAGARNAGIRPIHVDRESGSATTDVVADLTQLEDLLTG